MAKKKKQSAGRDHVESPQTPEVGGPMAFDEETGVFGDSDAQKEEWTPIANSGGTWGLLPESSKETAAGKPAIPSPDQGGKDVYGDLDELDDVLVLLPDEEDQTFKTSPGFSDAPTLSSTDATLGGISGASFDSVSFDATSSGGAPDSLASDHWGGPSIGDSTTRAEDVGLLSQHPEHDLYLQGHPQVSELVELPDIEDVEDITSLVDEAALGGFSMTQEEIDEGLLTVEATEDRSSWLGTLLRLVALLVIVGGGIVLGPQLFEEYFLEGEASSLLVRGTAESESLNQHDTNLTPVDPLEKTEIVEGASAAAQLAEAQFKQWIDGVLASNLGVNAQEGR